MPLKKQANYGVLPADGFIGKKILLQVVPYDYSTLFRKWKKGEFPAPTKLSTQKNVWKVKDIRDWMESFNKP